MWPFGFLRSARRKKQAYSLYEALVAQSRQPIFFQKFGVKDDENGRFDILVLHVALVMIALRERQEPLAMELGRGLGECFISDMDDNLREMGAGDLGVARRVKFMAGALNGRLLAYKAAIEGQGREIEEVLAKNLYRQEAISPEILQSMALYGKAAAKGLENQGTSALLLGEVIFPVPAVS